MVERDKTAPPEMMRLPKGYEPGEVEPRWAEVWAERAVGTPDRDTRAEAFSMVIPPPNVTGSLHLGHALDHTIQDIMARWKRMQGYDVLWVPGTDHAGIGTQNVVEKQLAAEGTSRAELGREKFERRVWEWKEQYGGKILQQMRREGATVDWSRERFTLDAGLSRAVRKVFVDLYEQGLIYRGEYLVNWCPRCETAISDLEVEHRDTDGRLWRIRYPLVPEASGSGEAGGEGPEFVEVETTRPETMLGDTALAVNPTDRRYRRLIGRTATLPIIGRALPIIGDDFVDPEFGTGIVKVTPGHDPNDYEAGLRHGLERVAVIGNNGTMTAAAGPFAGQDRFAARAGVAERLRAEGLLAGERQHRHAVGHCARCDTVIEPLVSLQWFVKMKPLAEPALEVVENGTIRFIPEHTIKTYREWMRNIRDWCISRQLWWGHRIPAWYCDACGSTIVAVDDPEGCSCGGSWRQETDVLDTWFSSALWPFSTLGWPEESDDLARYYPGALLVTAYDIIFFWVARMIFMGLRFRGQEPFREVFFHGLVRDEHGQKMSKSRGNVVDPLEIIEEFGADSLRFTLASMASPGSDMALSLDRLSGYRAFCNKLWNAARFALMNLGDQRAAAQVAADAGALRAAGVTQGVAGSPAAAAHPEARALEARALADLPATLADRWILSRFASSLSMFEENLANYRFDEASLGLYHFIWHEFCDWYVEMAKPALWSDDVEVVRRTRATLLATLEGLLGALHPIMPFITEEIWSRLPGERDLLCLSSWPQAPSSWFDRESEVEVGLLQALVTEARRLRHDFNVEPGRHVPVDLVSDEPKRRAELEEIVDYVAVLARAQPARVVATTDGDEAAIHASIGDVEVVVRLAEVVDLDAERQRIGANVAAVSKELAELEARLGNPGFVGKAPAAVVDKVRGRCRELRSERERLARHLRSLGA